MKKEIIILTTVGVVVLSSAMLGSAFLLSKKDTYIKNLGSSSLLNDKVLNTISVTGNGIVYSKPDIVSFNLSTSEQMKTVKEAQDAVNERMAKIREVLKNNNIAEKDIKTTQYNIYAEYDSYGANRKLIGHRATQTLNVKIRNIDEKATRAVKVLDEVTLVDKAEIHYIAFDIDDKTELFKKARELAFQKAKQKASELSGMSDVKLLTPVSISDSSQDYIQSTYNNVQTFREDVISKNVAYAPSQVSTGETGVSVQLNVIFGIE